MTNKKALIIGIDPGSTSAVAGIDLDGEIHLLESGKNFPPSEIIERVVKVGSPVVIASDKEKTPSTVENIATSLGAEIFEPEKDLSSERKRKLGKGANSHEKDAVASAVHAHKQLQKEINKIEKYEKKLEIERPEVAKRYFSDRPLEPKKDEKEESKTQEKKKEEPEVERDREKERMERKIENLEEQVSSLKSELGEEQKEKQSLRKKHQDLKDGKRDEALKDQEISKREGIIKEKNRKVEELEEKLGKAQIREQQYQKAIKQLKQGAQIIPIIDEKAEQIPEKAVTRSDHVRDRLQKRGFNIHKVEEIEGIELGNHHVVKEFPENAEDFEEIIKEYRESR